MKLWSGKTTKKTTWKIENLTTVRNFFTSAAEVVISSGGMMEEKYKEQIQGVGPHSAHLLLKIVVLLLATLFYAVGQFYGYWTALAISVGIYLIVPFCLKFSSVLIKNLIFLHNAWWPSAPPNYFAPESHGVLGGRNFYLNPKTGKEDSAGIGVWHILPATLATGSTSKPEVFWTDSLHDAAADDKPIILYFHGNMGSRATGHRVDLYKMLQELLDSHVIAFDYRGFADTSPQISPSESSTVADGLVVYKWICENCRVRPRRPKLFVWGHSLGTGISTGLLSKLANNESQHQQHVADISNPLKIHGLILEAPFSSMCDAFRAFPLNQIYRFWPIFDWLFIEPLHKNDSAFESDVYVQDLNDIPLAVLHGTNDVVVPFKLGEKLYQLGKLARESCPTSKPIYFHRFDSLHYTLAHTFLYVETKFPTVIQQFIKECCRTHNSHS